MEEQDHLNRSFIDWRYIVMGYINSVIFVMEFASGLTRFFSVTDYIRGKEMAKSFCP